MVVQDEHSLPVSLSFEEILILRAAIKYVDDEPFENGFRTLLDGIDDRLRLVENQFRRSAHRFSDL